MGRNGLEAYMAPLQNKNQPTQENIHVGGYVVAFLDILGQQDALRKITALPNVEIPEEIKTFEMAVYDLYTPIKALRKFFTSAIESFREGGIDPKTLTH